MLELNNVSKSYGSNLILEKLSFKLEKSNCLAILGESGSGKSTCLKLINRLLEVDSGDIFFNQKNIKDYDLLELRKKVSYLFQKGLLFPHMTVEENIALPVSNLKDKNFIDYRLSELLSLMDLEPTIFKNRYPRELSGGQSQRVSLAQALAADPELILLDEPFTGLDRKTKYSLMEKILEIKDRLHKTMILVTHDLEEAKFLADKKIELN